MSELKPRRLEDTIAAMHCTPDTRARLLAKLAAARESCRLAIAAVRARRIPADEPEDSFLTGDIALRLAEALEQARHAPAMSIKEALAMLEAHGETKH